MESFFKQVHDLLVRSDCEADASVYRDIRISFSDGSVGYNKVLLGVLEPVVIDALRGITDLEDITIIYPDKSLDCLKECGKPQTIFCDFEEEDVLESEDQIVSTVVETNYCSICDKNYPTKKQFRKHYYYKHYNSHSGNDDLFNRRSPSGRIRENIQNRLAGDGKKITCSTCGKTFKRIQGLTRHIETVHSSAGVLTRFHCNFCDSSFNRKDNLFKHVSKAHPSI